MAKCSHCGGEHDGLEPMFLRPDAWLALSDDEREQHGKADDDLCRIALPGQPTRHFVRCVLPVAVHDREDDIAWGLWAEVDADTFQRVLDRWSDDDQADEPPFDARIATALPRARTVGLPATMHLTGPTSRPELRFADDVEHEFAAECRRGVSAARADEWLSWTLHDNPLHRHHLAAYVCRHVFEGVDVLFVAHDAEDGAWQFLCGAPHGDAPDDVPRVVGVGHLTERDDTLWELGERLRPGAAAERDRVGAPWRVLPASHQTDT